MESASIPDLITGISLGNAGWWERQGLGNAGLACHAITAMFTLGNSWWWVPRVVIGRAWLAAAAQAALALIAAACGLYGWPVLSTA